MVRAVSHVIDQYGGRDESDIANLRATLKALMLGTYRELCADRHPLQCCACSMRSDDDKSCAVADAMELLGIEVP